MAGNYEVRRGSIVLKKSQLGQTKQEVTDSENPMINTINTELKHFFAQFTSDIAIVTEFYDKSQRAWMKILKVAGGSAGQTFACDADHSLLMLQASAIIFAKIGYSAKALKEAGEFVLAKAEEMRKEYGDE